MIGRSNERTSSGSQPRLSMGRLFCLSGWAVAAVLLLGVLRSPHFGLETAHPLPEAAVYLPNTEIGEPDASAETRNPLDRVAAFKAHQQACEGPCVTPFGSRLGAADGVEARSNCVSTCLRLTSSFVNPQSGEIRVGRESPNSQRFEYAGLTYQCVEYARRWWIRRLGLTFGDVPTAADIFGLTQGQRLPGHQAVPLGRSVNGLARRSPERGDLLIYAADTQDPDWRAGHVAVVVQVDLDQGWVALAEENYDNRAWQAPDAYARRIRLFAVGGRYTLVDVPPGEGGNRDGGRILGWVYPLSQP